MRRSGLLVLAAALVASVAGCATTPDDEATPRPAVTRTVNAAPAPRPAPIPPVADPPPVTATASARGSRLQVGERSADLSPVHVDAFALTRGGVFVLDGPRLWLTDLRELRDSGYHRVRSLAVSGDGRYLGFVELPDTGSGTVAVALVYDTTSGRAVVASTSGMAGAGAGAGAGGGEPRARGFLPDGRFVALTPRGPTAYPLDGGAPVALSARQAALAGPGRVVVAAGSVPG